MKSMISSPVQYGASKAMTIINESTQYLNSSNSVLKIEKVQNQLVTNTLHSSIQTKYTAIVKIVMIPRATPHYTTQD